LGRTGSGPPGSADERASLLGISDYDRMSVDEPRAVYMSVDRYLQLHPDQVGEINEMSHRISVDRLLSDGRCEFCDGRPIAWSHEFDDELIAPRHDHVHWLMCDACQSLYAASDDRGLLTGIVTSVAQT
jgi:hypothetical protein